MPEPTNAVRQPASRHSHSGAARHEPALLTARRTPGDPGPQPLYHDSVKTCITYSTALYEVPVPDPDPLDPFGFEEDNESEPIDDEERAALLEDLADLAEFREALDARGFVDGLLEGERETTTLRDGWTSPIEASRRLRRALATRGLTEDEVTAVLSEGGLPLGDPGEQPF